MADFLSNLRMNNIYGKPGELGPPNMNPGINLDEISNVLNRVHDYQYSRGKDELNNQLELMKANRNPNLGLDPNAVSRASGLNQNIGTNRVNAIAGGVPQPQQMNTVLADPQNKQVLAQQQLAEKKNEFGQTIGEKRNEFGQTLGEKQTEFAGKQDQGQQKIDISGQRADISQYSADTRRQLANLHNLPDSEKLRLLQEGKIDIQHLRDAAALNQIGARGMQNRQTQQQGNTQKGENSLANIAAKGNEARDTKQTPSGQAQLPTQTSRDQYNRAQELVNSNPELKQHIHLDPSTKTFIVDEPSTGFFKSGPNADQYQQIRDKIYGAKSDESTDKPEDKTSTKKPDPLGIRPDEDEEE